MPATWTYSRPQPAAASGGRSVWLRLVHDQCGVELVECVIVIAVLGLGLVVGAQRLRAAVESAAGSVGERVIAMASAAVSLNPPMDTQVTRVPSPPPPVTEQQLDAWREREPTAVRDDWARLNQAQRDRAIAEHPGRVGALDGVPAVDRDRANRLLLDRELAAAKSKQQALQARLGDRSEAPGPAPTRQAYQDQALRAELAAADADVKKLESLRDRLAPSPEHPEPKFLLGLDPAGDGKVIIALGNPDLARHSAVYVPGLNTTLESATGGDVTRVENVQHAARQLLGSADEAVSTIVYLGYDAPELDSVLDDGRSKQGAPGLRDFVDGLRATHAGGPYHVTAMGHSYGSTVIADAAMGGELAVDDIVVAGSPGLHTDRAENLADPQHVWVGASRTDPVASSGSYPHVVAALGGPLAGSAQWLAERLHGPSPQNPEFGANEFVATSSGHSDYYNYADDGAPSDDLRNQAAVVVGRYSEVETRHGEAPPDLEP